MTITQISIDTSSCSPSTAGANSLHIIAKLDSWQAGDTVFITGIYGSGFTSWTSTGTEFSYKYTLSAANSINSTYVTIPLTYNNPTFAITNYIETLKVYNNQLSPAVMYAQTGSMLAVCDVTNATLMQSLSFSKSFSLTFAESVTN